MTRPFATALDHVFSHGIASCALCAATAVAQPTVHPTKQNLDVPSSAIEQVTKESTTNRTLLAWVSRLNEARVVWTVGREDGRPEEVLGSLAAAVLDSRGRLAVLDRSFESVKLFSRNEQTPIELSRKGSGPLEMRHGITLWPSGVDEFTLVDVIFGAKILKVSGRRTDLVRQIPLGGGVQWACRTSRGVAAYSSTGDEKPLVHEFDPSGKLLASVGSAYVASSALVRSVMSEGTMACLQDTSFLVVMSKLPFVKKISADGRLRWVLRLRDFVVATETEDNDSQGRHSIGVSSGVNSWSYTLRVLELNPDVGLVQVAHHDAKSLRARASWARLTSYLVDLRTGESVAIGAKLPLVGQVTGDQLVAIENEPFPRAIVFQIPPDQKRKVLP